MSNYIRPTLIARSPLSGWGSDIKSILGGAFGVIASGEQAKGAAAALSAQQQMNLMNMQAGQGTILGFQPMTLLLLGGLGFGAYMLLKKKKAPTP